MTMPDGGRADGRSGGGRSRVRLAAASALVLVFVAGVGAGWVARDQARPSRRGRPNAQWSGGRRDPLARLNLSPAERARVDSVVARRRPQVDAFWNGPGAQLRGIMDSMRVEMRAAMDPAHRAAFDSLPVPGRRGPRDGGGGPR